MAILKDEYVIDGMAELRQSMADFQKELDKTPPTTPKPTSPTNPYLWMTMGIAIGTLIAIGVMKYHI